MTFQTVVAGLDLGPVSPPVAELARVLARQLHVKLVYVHAEDAVSLGADWAELALEAERFRVEAAERYAITGGAEFAWREGPTAAVLQDEAEARAAAFVVVGTGAAGRGPALGATATRLMRTMTVPLCIVPTHLEARPVPVNGVRKVLAPVDVGTEGDDSLRVVGRLVRLLDCKLGLVTVVKPPKLVAHLSPERSVQLPAFVRAQVEGARARLARRAAHAELPEVTQQVVEADDVAQAILDEARRVDADMIVLPSQGKRTLERLFIGSTTEALVRSSDRPVLVLPPTWVAVHPGWE
jgi:nucleotide-binding universal stress UspA family protein